MEIFSLFSITEQHYVSKFFTYLYGLCSFLCFDTQNPEILEFQLRMLMKQNKNDNEK